MSILTEPHLSLPQPDGVSFSRVEPKRREEALALLLTGRTDCAAAAVENFLSFAAKQSLDLNQLFAAYPAPRLDPSLPRATATLPSPVASLLVVPCAGRTAMLFLSPMTDAGATPIVANLLRVAMAQQEAGRVRLAQALLEAPQKHEAAALLAAGFRKLAHLAYLQHPGLPRVVDLSLPREIEVITWGESRRQLFADAILASYEDTADCPALLGTRPIEDIMAGHMATGQFEPTLWKVLSHGGKPVGVMLLNLVLEGAALELVYFGLAKSWRGRGLGRKMLEHAASLVKSWRAQQMILAVDELNAAALKLYRSLGFRQTARKLAMILTLP